MKQFAEFTLNQRWFEYGERRCRAKVKVMVSRFHNGHKDPTMLDITWPKVEDVEIDLRYVILSKDGEAVGRVEDFEIPRAEQVFWERQIVDRVNRYVSNTEPYNYEWVSDESTF